MDFERYHRAPCDDRGPTSRRSWDLFSVRPGVTTSDRALGTPWVTEAMSFCISSRPRLPDRHTSVIRHQRPRHPHHHLRPPTEHRLKPQLHDLLCRTRPEACIKSHPSELSRGVVRYMTSSESPRLRQRLGMLAPTFTTARLNGGIESPGYRSRYDVSNPTSYSACSTRELPQPLGEDLRSDSRNVLLELVEAQPAAGRAGAESRSCTRARAARRVPDRRRVAYLHNSSGRDGELNQGHARLPANASRWKT